MIRSFFTATSGAITENKNLSIRSNNIANVNTAGFKKDTPINSTFGDMLLTRLNNDSSGIIGNGDFVNVAQTPYTDFSQGGFNDTGRNLDFAIIGDGYFSIQTEGGETYLTRNGEFFINNEGYLSHIRGGYVLDVDGAPIMMPGDDFTVSNQGDIQADGMYIARVGVSTVDDPTRLIKVDDGFFRSPDGATINAIPQVASKTLEHSNVNMTQEMTDAIASSRHFQTCSQAMKMIDEMTQKTVNEIARM